MARLLWHHMRIQCAFIIGTPSEKLLTVDLKPSVFMYANSHYNRLG